MSSLIDVLKGKIIPFASIVFYRPNVTLDDGDGYLAEFHKIKGGKMCAGRPLRIKEFTALLKKCERFAGKQVGFSNLHGIIPPNLIYASCDIDNMKLIWYRKPEKRRLYFTESLGIPNGEMYVPGVVYYASGNGLKVYVYKGNMPKSVLYNAPFYNVYNDGRVCLGNSKVPKPKENTFTAWMEYWENLFWNSEFSHLISSTSPVKGNLATITKDCIVSCASFPVDVLIKSNVKIENLTKQ